MRKELNTRTYKHLILLAKELGIKNYSTYSKSKLIDEILKFRYRKIKSAENKVYNKKIHNIKTVSFFGLFNINRKLLIVTGILLGIFSIFSFSKNWKISKFYYLNIQIIGDVEFQISKPSNISPNYDYDKVNPLCGCKNEKPHYGLTFSSYNYSITFLNSRNEIDVPDLSIYAPNHVMPYVDVRKKIGTNNLEYKIKGYEPFSIKFDYFRVSKSDIYLNENNLKNYIYSLYSNNHIKHKTINTNKKIILRNITSKLRVVSLDDVIMSSIEAPYGTDVKILKNNSNIQDNVLEFMIINSFSNVDEKNYYTSEFDILGRINGYIFNNALVLNSDNEILFNDKISKDSLTLIVAKSGFSQKIKPINKKVSKVVVYADNTISKTDYTKMLSLFNIRKNNFYHVKTSDYVPNKKGFELYLYPPLIQDKPNGIHYYGYFNKFISEQTKGTIELKNKIKKLNFPQKVNIKKIDTMKLYKEPLVFQFNPNDNYYNSLLTSGNLEIDNEYFTLNSTEVILSYLWNIIYSIVSFIGSIIGISQGMKGLIFPDIKKFRTVRKKVRFKYD